MYTKSGTNMWSFYRTRRRRVAFSLLTLAFVATTVSGFTPASSKSTCLVAAHSQRENTKQHVSHSVYPSSGGSNLDFLSSAVSQPRHNDKSRMPRWTRNAVTRLFPKTRKKEQENDYERRKQEWAEQYTNVDSLRRLFGENRNKVWGDLDAETARRLYKTLLPKALLEMLKMGVQPEDLAPLAYKARLAAKLYARERCYVPGRIFAATFDGVRQWKRYGKFQPSGMTYPQVWEKYESLILEELGDDNGQLTDEDVTAKICLKILERSCQTNERVDRWILRDHDNTDPKNTLALKEQEKDLNTVIEQLENDVHELLKPSRREEREWKASKIKTLRLLVRAKKRLDMLHPSANDEDECDNHMNVPWNDRPRKHDNRPKEWEDRRKQ